VLDIRSNISRQWGCLGKISILSYLDKSRTNLCISGDMFAVNAYKIGWKAKWDEKRFMECIDDEVVAVLELDTVKASVFNTLLADDK